MSKKSKTKRTRKSYRNKKKKRTQKRLDELVRKPIAPPTKTHKPKKGKGSYNRKREKHDENKSIFTRMC